MSPVHDQAGAERRLQSMMRSLQEAGIGTWSYDAAADHVRGDGGLAALFGLAPGVAATSPLATFLARIHPEDRERVRQAVARAMATGGRYEAEYRIVREDGSVRWVSARGRVEQDPASGARLMEGALVDITRRLQDEQALRESEERYRRLLEVQRAVEESLRRSQEELQAAVERLRDEDRRKDDFLAMLGHELRNPLAAIAGGLRLWHDGADPARLRWIRQVLNRQAALLGRLVDDLLDISRFSRGKVSLHKRPVRLVEVIEHATTAVRESLQDRRHRLSLKVPPELRLEADPDRLEQVVANLLGNSSRYMAPGGLIEVRAEREGDRIVLAVRDEGIGMTSEALATVFDLFRQDGPAAARDQGLGVGLSLVRVIVQLHGGVVTADSPGPGRGSTFTVRLPGALEPEAVAAPAEAAGSSVEGGSAAVEAEIETEAEPERPAAPGLSRRILLVDDNRDLVETLQLALEAAGHRVRVAFEGHGALAAARREKPELVLVDIGLPGMDGRELARRLRAEGCEHVPMFAISGFGTERDLRLSKDAGLDAHIVKPIQVDRLLAMIEAAFPPPPGVGTPEAEAAADAAGGTAWPRGGDGPRGGEAPRTRAPARFPGAARQPGDRTEPAEPLRRQAAGHFAAGPDFGPAAEPGTGPVAEPAGMPAGGTPAAAGGGTRVLLVEDSRIVAELSRTLLQERGYEVEVAEDAAAGLALCGTFAPTVVLCDLNLPGGRSGFELAQEIAAGDFRDLEGRRPLLIAVTAHSEEDVAPQLRGSGFRALLTKPLDFERLNAVVSEYLSLPPE